MDTLDTCLNCDGTGLVRYKGEDVTCFVCHGTGKCGNCSHCSLEAYDFSTGCAACAIEVGLIEGGISLEELKAMEKWERRRFR